MSGWGWVVLAVMAVGCAVAEYRVYRGRRGLREMDALLTSALDELSATRQSRDVAHALADTSLRRVTTIGLELADARSATRAAQARLVACASCERRPRYDEGGLIPRGVPAVAIEVDEVARKQPNPVTSLDVAPVEPEALPAPFEPGPAAMPSGVAAVHRRARRGRGGRS